MLFELLNQLNNERHDAQYLQKEFTDQYQLLQLFDYICVTDFYYYHWKYKIRLGNEPYVLSLTVQLQSCELQNLVKHVLSYSKTEKYHFAKMRQSFYVGRAFDSKTALN
jgi:hypothetical protein